MTIVVITSRNPSNAEKYLDALPARVQTRLVTAAQISTPPATLMQGAGGLLLTGGADIDPHHYGETPQPDASLELCRDLDTLELGLLEQALAYDIPVLAICRGMQLLNVAFGGRLLQDIEGHKAERRDGSWVAAKHDIYLSPGSKLAAILEMGGFFKVNSLHHQGLREPQKSPRLLATAYSLEDGIIEGLESPEHSWVVGIQCHPERREEVPRVFANLFLAFAERAEGYGEEGDGEA